MKSIEPWYSVEEIARHLGVSKETIYRWIEKRKIPVHRMGKLWKFKPSEVDSWIQNGGAEEVPAQTNRRTNSHSTLPS